MSYSAKSSGTAAWQSSGTTCSPGAAVGGAGDSKGSLEGAAVASVGDGASTGSEDGVAHPLLSSSRAATLAHASRDSVDMCSP